jgi:hypothetical protein
MKRFVCRVVGAAVVPLVAAIAGCSRNAVHDNERAASLAACKRLVEGGARPIAEDRADRFLGKVQPDTALCRGGARALAAVERGTPWLD